MRRLVVIRNNEKNLQMELLAGKNSLALRWYKPGRVEVHTIDTSNVQDVIDSLSLIKPSEFFTFFYNDINISHTEAGHTLVYSNKLAIYQADEMIFFPDDNKPV